ncbi:MAG: hypothetical protein B7Y59_11210 [Burkholderiales bacterium 35-55-47]|nr:MAG: hypothetical protein B7Y59_11210 [Burkholderiales bacterium 35-55-47]OYZ72194.1 MAG: hypothetical protein B7Y06_11355 [Burkholderiales bacterium 24-55-52]OZA99566.1 MAG: hypothetical protein B7X62_09840 [Burkholderiales bacterium 39-55-53]
MPHRACTSRKISQYKTPAKPVQLAFLYRQFEIAPRCCGAGNKAAIKTPNHEPALSKIMKKTTATTHETEAASGDVKNQNLNTEALKAGASSTNTPVSSWGESATLSTLWGARHFVAGSVRREFQSRYTNSLLGPAWPFLQPAVMILIYTVVFSRLMQAKIPSLQGEASYSIFLCAGLVAWNLFAELLTRLTTLFVDNANLLKKVRFPWECLPVITLASGVLNHIIMTSLVFVVLLLLGGGAWGVWPHLLPVLALLVFFASGLGLVLALVNVFFRDVAQLLAITLQLLFWLTPVVYPLSVLPEYAQRVIALNPLLPIVQAYQSVLAYEAAPEYSAMLYPLVLGVVVWAIALRMAKKLLPDVVDEL